MATRVIGKTSKTKRRLLPAKAVVYSLMAGILPGLVLLSSYLAAIMGEGIPHLFATLLLLVAAPFISIHRLLAGQSKRLLKTLSLWGAFSWLFSLILLLGALEKTSTVLKEHGAWPLSFAGKKKRARGDKIVRRLVSTLPTLKGVPYRYEGGSIIIAGYAKEGSERAKVRFVLDTGASITTISSRLAAKLGLTPRGPAIEVQTASGVARYPLVTLDQIALSRDFYVGPLSVAICDPCTGEGTDGLLGLNFTSHFQIKINSKEAMIKLKKRTSWVDQREDLDPYVDISGLSGDLNKDRFVVTGAVSSRASKPMKGLVFQITIKGPEGKIYERKRVKLPTLAPGTPKNIKVTCAPYKDIKAFEVDLVRGFWK